MRLFLLIILCFPFVLFSQNKRAVFVEGGTSILHPFHREDNLYVDWGSTGNSYTKTNRISIFSVFLKLGIETPITRRKHFSFSVPLSIGYREQRISYSDEILQTYYYGHTEHYLIKTKYHTGYFGLIFGPKFNINLEKWSLFTAINFNSELFLFGRKNVSENSSYGTNDLYLSEGIVFDVAFSPSLQTCVLKHIGSNFSVGLTSDFFLYHYNPQDSKYHHHSNDHLFNFGYGKYSSIINAGIRLQYSY